MAEELSIQQRILLTTREMMFVNGVRSTSMDDIAGKMGISKKTIYQYFTDKDALVESLMKDVITSNKNCCCADNSNAKNAIHEAFLNIESISTMFRTIHNAVMHDIEKYHPRVFRFMEDHREDYIFNVIKSNILRGQKENLYRKDISVEIISRYRVESIFLFFTKSFQKHITNSFLETEKEIMTHFIYGLVTPKGYIEIAKYKN